jgi:hypothetical protein
MWLPRDTSCALNTTIQANFLIEREVMKLQSEIDFKKTVNVTNIKCLQNLEDFLLKFRDSRERFLFVGNRHRFVYNN